VNAIIQAPVEIIQQRLRGQRVGAAQAGEDDFPHICDAVGPAVLQIDQVGASRDEHAAPVTRHRRGPRQVVCIDRARAVFPRPLGVLEQANAAHRPVRSAPADVTGPFDHEQAAVLGKRHGDGGDDHRFGGDQVQAEPRLHAEARQRLNRRVGQDLWHGVGGGLGFGRPGGAGKANEGCGKGQDRRAAQSPTSPLRFAHGLTFVQFCPTEKAKRLELPRPNRHTRQR
jgi:hypothetical protein